MSLKSYIVPRIAARIFDQERAERRRRKVDEAIESAPEIEVFLDPNDPYSILLDAVLPNLETRYDITLTRHIVSPAVDAMVPERQALSAYAAIDARRLATKAGIGVDLSPQAPDGTDDGNARLRTLGHYQGGMIHYGGDWYWGLDRLHYLERRLTRMGRRRDASPDALIFDPPTVPQDPTIPKGRGDTGRTLHWYLSFRSPYTAIVADRVAALADAYGAELKLRFVLPMVMRNLSVPKTKARYIAYDTAREADWLSIPFGRLCDPVGRPVERGYAVLHWAMQQGRGFDFAQSFLRMVWSEGVDAGSDRGLKKIVEDAGLDWAHARAQLNSDDWRAVAETNRVEMMSYGIWGVPSFRVDETAVWGQDRLWVVEDALRDALRDGS